MSAAVIAAVAATTAAVVSLISTGVAVVRLIVTGRRAERAWRRETLQQVIADVLGASYSGAGSRAYIAASAGADLAIHRAAAEQAHQQQNAARTLLRLLGTEPLVQAADVLHDADEKVWLAVLSPDGAVNAEDWSLLRANQAHARTELVGAARNEFAVIGKPAVPPPTSLTERQAVTWH